MSINLVEILEVPSAEEYLRRREKALVDLRNSGLLNFMLHFRAEVVEYVLQQQGNPDAISGAGSTPLLIAARSGARITVFLGCG